MYITINIFEALIAIFFSTSFFFSYFNFQKLGGCGAPGYERIETVIKLRDHLIYAIVNLIIYIILRGNIFVFLACLPLGYALEFILDKYAGYSDYKSISINSVSFNIVYSILNTILIIVAFIFR